LLIIDGLRIFSGGYTQDGPCSIGGSADIDIPHSPGFVFANPSRFVVGGQSGIPALNNTAVYLWCGDPAGIIPGSIYNAFAGVLLAFLALIDSSQYKFAIF